MENINRFRFDDKPSCKLLLHSESKVQHNNNKLENMEISAVLHSIVREAIIWLAGDRNGDDA